MKSHLFIFYFVVCAFDVISKTNIMRFSPYSRGFIFFILCWSFYLAWKVPWTAEPGGLQSVGSLRVWHDWATSLSLFSFHFSLSCIGEGNDNPLQYSCLENPRDSGACWVAFCGVAQSLRWLSSSSSKALVIYFKDCRYRYYQLFYVFVSLVI